MMRVSFMRVLEHSKCFTLIFSRARLYVSLLVGRYTTIESTVVWFSDECELYFMTKLNHAERRSINTLQRLKKL